MISLSFSLPFRFVSFPVFFSFSLLFFLYIACLCFICLFFCLTRPCERERERERERDEIELDYVRVVGQRGEETEIV